jgi:hypothetical protein
MNIVYPQIIYTDIGIQPLPILADTEAGGIALGYKIISFSDRHNQLIQTTYITGGEIPPKYSFLIKQY